MTQAATRIAQIEARLPVMRAHLATATLASVRDITLGTIERLEAELADLKQRFA